jgi:hypothetical protein
MAGLFRASNRLAVPETFMIIRTDTTDADSLSSTLEAAVRLYFEPLSWIRKAAKRIAAEVADGIFPGLSHKPPPD